MFELFSMGFGPFFEKQINSAQDSHLNSGADGSSLATGSFPSCGIIPARIISEHKGSYVVWWGQQSGSQSGSCPDRPGQLGQSGRQNHSDTTGHSHHASPISAPAQLAGRLRMELEGKSNGLPGVGDWVLLRHAPSEANPTAIIEHALERRTCFTRGSVGRTAQVQVIAANVDLVFVVCGLDSDYNLRRIERYLARIWASGAQPAVILNKADVCRTTAYANSHANTNANAHAHANGGMDKAAVRIGEVEGSCPGVPVLVISALHQEGIDAVRSFIHDGMTVAFVGSSGAGKSTLVNALLGEDLMATASVRAGAGRGRHTTTHRQMVLLPGGGVLLDTPGMRELQLVDGDGLADVFDDIATLTMECRFRDCSHDGEPGCAVQKAVEAGELSAARLEHYLKLEHEAMAYERRHDERLRRQTERVWGQLHAEVARMRRWKGGKH